MEAQFLYIIIERPKLVYDVIIDGVFDGLHRVVKEFGEVLVGLAFVVFYLFVHQNLKPL